MISQSSSPARETVVSGGRISDAPIPLRLGWQPTGSGLRMAWEEARDRRLLGRQPVEGRSGCRERQAARGRRLDAKDTLTDLASTLKRPRATAGNAARFGPALGVVTPNPVNDGSSYRVLEIPTERPNDGPRTLVTNPADATASPFGWHDTNGAPGAEFTITQGNNAHAYLDQDNNNAMDFGGSPTGEASRSTSGRPERARAELPQRRGLEPLLYEQRLPRHHVRLRVHRGGFGNFQANNYGRGGTQGDYVRAEAADGGGTNNANFSTPVETPTSAARRMQMYLWPGNQFGAQNQVVVNGLESFDSSWARFGPRRPLPSVGTDHQRRERLRGRRLRIGSVSDWIAIVVGGNVGARTSSRPARPGSRREGGDRFPQHVRRGTGHDGLDDHSTAHTIPAASITQADGNAIRAAIAAGTTTGTVRKHPSHPGIRDGDFENGIIIHEYGHGISNRLTGGPTATASAGTSRPARAGATTRPRSCSTPRWTIGGCARDGAVCAVPGRPARRRHPAAAVLAQHGDPAVRTTASRRAAG